MRCPDRMADRSKIVSSSSSSAPSQRIRLPKAFEGLFRPARYKAFYGGRGSGKSHSVASALVLRGAQAPIRWGCYREIQKSIRDSSKRLLDDKIVEHGLEWFYESTDAEVRGRNGTLFVFAGLKSNTDSVKSTEGLDGAWVEEAQSVSKASIEILVPTVRKPGSELWFTWNPRHEKDPVDAMFRGAAGPPPSSIVRGVNFDENPWFPDVLREDMEWDKRRDADKYAHIWLGGYQRNSEARVFRNWRVGSRDEFLPDPARTYRFGADWGFSVDPTVLVRCYIEGRTLYIDREAYLVGCEIDKTPALFDTIGGSRNWTIRADSARPETISYMQRQGFKIVPAIKGAGSVEDGVEFLKSYDIVVHPDCTHTIDELTLYSFMIDKLTGEVLPVLEDKHNHCVAAGELVQTRRGPAPIETIVVGDMVLTRAGWRRVLAAWKAGDDREVMLVKAGHGLVWVTSDHEIFTIGRGWIRADALRYDDDVLISVSVAEWCMSKLRNSTVAFIGATRTLLIGALASISGLVVTEDATCCIGMSGDSIMGLSRTGATSIMLTKTRPTILRRTLNASQRAIIDRIIRKSGCQTIRCAQGSQSIWIPFGPLRRLGTRALMAWQSIARSALSHIGISSPSASRASIAERCSLLGSSDISTSSARMLASRHTGGRLALMTRFVSAIHATAHLLRIGSLGRRLVPARVQIGGEQRRSAVYDLTVEEHHEFVAGGVLVSNCLDAARYAVEGERRVTAEPRVRRF